MITLIELENLLFANFELKTTDIQSAVSVIDLKMKTQSDFMKVSMSNVRFSNSLRPYIANHLDQRLDPGSCAFKYRYPKSSRKKW